MLDIGIIGVGSAWDSRYRPALRTLSDRIRVKAIFDAVANRAELAANDFEAKVSEGILSVVARPDVKAILLLDQNWHGHAALRFACFHQKPVYIAGSLGTQREPLEFLRLTAANHGLDFMPEFSRRYTPATTRLRELCATKLGRVRELQAKVPFPNTLVEPCIPGQETECDFLLGLIDWCQYLVGTAPNWIHVHRHFGKIHLNGHTAGIAKSHQNGHVPAIPPVTSPGDDPVWCDLSIGFRQSAADKELARANLQILRPTDDANPTPLHCEVRCKSGTATIEGASVIHWSLNSESAQAEPIEGTETLTERLTTERPDVEVMLDHFSRRVVGGLIPVPNIDDVCHALAVVHAAQTSLERGARIHLG